MKRRFMIGTIVQSKRIAPMLFSACNKRTASMLIPACRKRIAPMLFPACRKRIASKKENNYDKV